MPWAGDEEREKQELDSHPILGLQEDSRQPRLGMFLCHPDVGLPSFYQQQESQPLAG